MIYFHSFFALAMCNILRNFHAISLRCFFDMRKKLYIFFLLKLYACLVENNVSKQKPNWGKRKKNQLTKRLRMEVKGGKNVEMKRTVRVIEVSIYKWTRCPIFISHRAEKKNSPKNSNVKKKKYRTLCVCMCLMMASGKAPRRRKQGGKLNGEEV